jgi:hypothetical protein
MTDTTAALIAEMSEKGHSDGGPALGSTSGSFMARPGQDATTCGGVPDLVIYEQVNRNSSGEPQAGPVDHSGDIPERWLREIGFAMFAPDNRRAAVPLALADGSAEDSGLCELSIVRDKESLVLHRCRSCRGRDATAAGGLVDRISRVLQCEEDGPRGAEPRDEEGRGGRGNCWFVRDGVVRVPKKLPILFVAVNRGQGPCAFGRAG